MAREGGKRKKGNCNRKKFNGGGGEERKGLIIFTTCKGEEWYACGIDTNGEKVKGSVGCPGRPAKKMLLKPGM